MEMHFVPVGALFSAVHVPEVLCLPLELEIFEYLDSLMAKMEEMTDLFPKFHSAFQ